MEWEIESSGYNEKTKKGKENLESTRSVGGKRKRIQIRIGIHSLSLCRWPHYRFTTGTVHIHWATLFTHQVATSPTSSTLQMALVDHWLCTAVHCTFFNCLWISGFSDVHCLESLLCSLEFGEHYLDYCTVWQIMSAMYQACVIQVTKLNFIKQKHNDLPWAYLGGGS